MSAAYKPVDWNANKVFYDSVLAIAVILYLFVFTWAAARPVGVQPYDEATIWMRAYGTCAFLMLSFVLCIGPLARLDSRFLPLLYNRRHFGVATCIVALMHARRVLAWYFSFSDLDPYAALLSSNTSVGRLAGFPFEWLGAAALLVLLVLAATSHDFWLKFLTPAIWKSVHMGLYPAYACIVAHVALGAMLTHETQALHFLVPACALPVVMLHLMAAYRQMKSDHGEDFAEWITVGPVHRIWEGRAIIVPIAGAESVAIFRNRGRLSAIANACAHQNGPLGEGRIVDGCVTCPWHGFQYRVEDGCAPPPFTEKLATYNLRVRDGVVLLDPRPNIPGTYVQPIEIEEGALSDEPFYVGYLSPADAVRRRMVLAAGIIWMLFGLAAVCLGRTPRDLGPSQFGDDIALNGIIVAKPYPMLVAAPDAEHPRGRTLLLGGEGKHGAQDFASALDGRSAHLDGLLIKRGDLDMVLISSPDQLKPESATQRAPRREHLGQWRLSGEICDGKCAAGAMRPGSGASHKACANLCISSGLPPVLALGKPLEGREVLILASEDGGPVPGEFLDLVGIPVTLEGTAHRLGDAIIFHVVKATR